MIEGSTRAVLFDLDGTLLDTLEDLADSANAVLRAEGLPVHPLEAYRYFVGDGVTSMMRRALGDKAEDTDLLARSVAAMRRTYADNWNRKTRPYPGVAQLLTALADRRMPMTVLSNKPDEFTRMCVQELLPHWRFARVQGMLSEDRRKPDPAAALEFAQALDVPPDDWLYLGDTATDMRTAVNAGMWPVGALWGFRTEEELRQAGAQALVAAPGDVLRLL